MKILTVGKFFEHADGKWEIVGWSFDGNIPTEHADLEAFKQDCMKHAKEAGTYIRLPGWRPEGWKNPYPSTIIEECKATGEVSAGGFIGSTSQQESDAFEAGANAMLKILKEKGAWMTPEQMRLLAPDRKYPYGHIVFIPEAKK